MTLAVAIVSYVHIEFQRVQTCSPGLDDPNFQDLAFRLLVKRIYDEIRGGKREAVGG